MNIFEIIWKDRFVEKISDKHAVTMEEVEEVLFSAHTFAGLKRGEPKVSISMRPTDKQKQAGT